MAPPQPAEPVKLVCAVLWREPEALAAASAALERRFGSIDWRGADHPFAVTGYYDEEMGTPLSRRLIAFAELFAAERLAEAKLAANAIEAEFSAAAGRRRVNLDIGYLDHHKLVLASAKAAGQKVYLGEGIHADMLCRCRGGRLEWFEWAFPDFRDGRYDAELLRVRQDYLERLKAWRRERRA